MKIASNDGERAVAFRLDEGNLAALIGAVTRGVASETTLSRNQGGTELHIPAEMQGKPMYVFTNQP